MLGPRRHAQIRIGVRPSPEHKSFVFPSILLQIKPCYIITQVYRIADISFLQGLSMKEKSYIKVDDLIILLCTTNTVKELSTIIYKFTTTKGYTLFQRKWFFFSSKNSDDS